MGLTSLLFCVCIKSIWCLTLDPYPTVNVTRYNSQSFNCSVDTNWTSVSYNYHSINIVLFAIQDGKCKDFAAPPPGLYTTYCDDSTRTFYLTINNVTDDYNGKAIECTVSYAGANPVKESLINVQYQPTTLPTITQTPVGPIIEGNRVTLTCTIQGGNPVATITWSCDGVTQITPTRGPSTVDANSSIELVTSKISNGQICTCTGRHLLWTNDKIQQHSITVYYSPTVSITNMDPIDVVENVTLKLVCQAMDGNPTVNSFSWYKGNSTTSIGMISNFNINKVIRTDSGEYRCEGSNGIGQNGTDTVYVNVLYNPEIVLLFVIDGNEIVENDTATIQCNVESNPLSKMEWTFENKMLNKGNHGVLQSNYSIQKAKCVDTGFYMCTATNIINMESYSDKRVVQLYVRCSPRRDTLFEPENQIGLALGQHLKMQIHIIAYPPPVVEWRFRSADKSTTKTFSSNCNQTSMFRHTACFEKDNVTQADFGQYSISVHNGLGNNFSYLFNVDPQGKVSESDSVIAVAAGTGSAAAALIIGVLVVIVVLRKRMLNAKGNENSDDKGRLNMTPIDGDEVVEGLQENDCYVSAGPPFRPKDTSAANYEVVERRDQGNANDVKQDSQETTLCSIVDKKTSGIKTQPIYQGSGLQAKGKTSSEEKTKDGPNQDEDAYESVTNQGSSDNQKQNVNKDGLQYSELMLNPLPNGSKFIIHGIEDKTIYAEVDTTQKIDPLPESDDEDKGNET